MPAPPPAPAAARLRVASELRGWSSNLPVIVLGTRDVGALQPLPNLPMVEGSFTVLAPVTGGRASLEGQPALSMRAGLRIRGSSSVEFPQKSYAVELRAASGDEDAAATMLGLPADSDFALVGGSLMDRSLMRNALAYAVSNEIGRYASRTRFVEVFLVEGDRPVAPGDYCGVYTLSEKIKRGKDRMNIAKLELDDRSEAGLSGGYSFRIDRGAADFMAGGVEFGFVYPDGDVIGAPAWAAQRAYLRNFVQEFFDTVVEPGFKHPRTGRHYEAYIDALSFIDYHLLNVLFKNVDAFMLSTYFYKDRGRPLQAGPLWDLDRSAGTPHDGRAVVAQEWASPTSANPMQFSFWGRLFADPSFRSAHKQRWQQLARGPFSLARVHGHIDRFAAELRESQARHFARWPEMPPMGGSHEAEVRVLKEWMAARISWLNAQL